MSSLELAVENGKEMLEFFKDKWTPEEYEKQLKLQELAEYNLSLWEGFDEEDEKKIEKKNKKKNKLSRRKDHERNRTENKRTMVHTR